MIPAFWPPIHPGDEQWPSIANNYSYDFKNQPYYFHNGGIWPVWMGLLALGLSHQGKKNIAEKILTDYLTIETPDSIEFHEYISANDLQPSGKKPLCYSAAGVVFMIKSIEGDNLEGIGFQ